MNDFDAAWMTVLSVLIAAAGAAAVFYAPVLVWKPVAGLVVMAWAMFVRSELRHREALRSQRTGPGLSGRTLPPPQA